MLLRESLEGRPIVPYEDLADAAGQTAEDAVHLGVDDPLGYDDHCLAANYGAGWGTAAARRQESQGGRLDPARPGVVSRLR